MSGYDGGPTEQQLLNDHYDSWFFKKALKKISKLKKFDDINKARKIAKKVLKKRKKAH